MLNELRCHFRIYLRIAASPLISIKECYELHPAKVTYVLIFMILKNVPIKLKKAGILEN